MQFSDIGKIAEDIWRKIPEHFEHTALDEFVVMPNHLHGVIHLFGADSSQDQYSLERKDTMDRSNNAELSAHRKDAINRNNNAKSSARRRYAINRNNNTESAAHRRDAINRVSTNIPKNIENASLSQIIRWYKGRTTFEIRKTVNPIFAWQTRFHDHIIRNETALDKIRNYIRENPRNWQQDDLYI